MKYLLIPIALLLLTSCQRRRDYVCYVTDKVEPNGITDWRTVTEWIYNKTWWEARQYEKDHSFVDSSDLIIITRTVNCR